MSNITLHNPENESLTSQLAALIKTLQQAGSEKEIIFDLSALQWACPLLILPIAAYCARKKCLPKTGENLAINEYLQAIHFPEGVSILSDFEQIAQKHKSYIPISILKRSNPLEREKMENEFVEMIFKIVQATAGSKNALYYPILELVNNIFDHSQEEQGYLFGQLFPKKNYLDMCIVDTGRGLAATYKQEKNIIVTDEEAIIEAMKGNSTKPLLDRGYGLRTSKRVVCEALGGGFIMVSGNAVLSAIKDKQVLTTIPDFYWQGVIIAYRIPKPSGAVDITPFLE